MTDQVLDRASNIGVQMKDETAKRRQILDGARDVFLNLGFDGASMSEIARAAGVSKGTLYVYFSSKEVLFENLIWDERRMQAERLFSFDRAASDIRAVLRQLGVSFLDSLTQPTSVAHTRTVIAVASKFPQIGRAFYEAGPSYGIQRLAEFLSGPTASASLNIDDTTLAATLFIELCLSKHFKKMLFCVASRPSPTEITEHIDNTVNFFHRIYGKQPARSVPCSFQDGKL
jgi:AcrR family transcriptional regulator